ncbi:hypothetical protein GCM10028799_09400 [Kribbella italica]
MLVIILKEDRLAEQIRELDPKRSGEFGQDIESTDLPLATLNLAEPVLGAADEVREHSLRQSASGTVESYPLTDAQMIASASHGYNDTQCAREDPDSLSGSSC